MKTIFKFSLFASLLSGIIILSTATLKAEEPLVYPTALSIQKFETDKVIYKTREKAKFICEFISHNNHQGNASDKVEIQIWLEREVARPELCASKSIQLKKGINREELSWGTDKNVFGHLATMKIIDGFGRTLGERETLFDVANNWVDVMRLASIGANKCATKDFPEDSMRLMIAKMRTAYINAFEVFTFSPKPYYLAPVENEWPYQYSKVVISKDKLIQWSKLLHQSGMKFVAYNETSAAEGPDDWKIYLKVVDNGKTPYAHYFKDKGMFVPNMLKIADLFSKELSESIKMFGWDGILMDSAIDGHKRTAEGMDKDGKNLTDLSIGEVGYKYLEKARESAKKVNPDFCFLSQNATTISHIGVKQDADKMYPWIKENAEKMKIRKYSELADIYTLEIDSHNEPRDGRYPLTYEKMSVALNSIVETTGRPLMSWAFVVPPYYDEYSVSFTRPYMSLIYASRTKLHDHFDFYGGALSDGSESPASKQFIKYNRFAARFSYYLWNPNFKWVIDPSQSMDIKGSRPLFWKRTAYQTNSEGGDIFTVVNLLNLPSNGTILSQKEIPDFFQNGVITLSGQIKDVKKVVFLNADDESIKPLELVPLSEDGGAKRYSIPPVEAWALLVIQSGTGNK